MTIPRLPVKQLKKYNQTMLYAVAAAAIAAGTYLTLAAFAGSAVQAYLLPKGRSPIYRAGDSVVFAVTNHSKQPITFVSSEPWMIAGSQGQIVYRPLVDDAPQELQPGETRWWKWDQRDQLGRQVLAGDYQAVITYQAAGKIEQAEVGFKVLMVK